MKRVHIKIRKNGAFMAAMFIFLLHTSCVKEVPVHDGLSQEEATVIFSLKLPGNSGLETRAVDTDKTIRTIEVLVFKEGLYRYTAYAEPENAGDTSIPVKLVKSVDDNDTYDLVILANSRISVMGENFVRGETKAAVLSALTKSFAGKWAVPLPMSSDPHLTTLQGLEIYEGKSFNVMLYQSLARVNITLSTAASANFELASVAVYNRHTQGTLVPYDSDNWNSVAGKAIYPTLGSDWETTQDPLVYDGAAVTATECVNQIYLFEAENHTGPEHTEPKPESERTYLVVGGYFKGAEELTYYRMDFSTGTESSETWYDVLRNHSYNFIITAVNPPQQALAYSATVVPWNEDPEQNVIADGPYSLTVNRDDLYFSASEGEEINITAETDYIENSAHSQGYKDGVRIDVEYYNNLGGKVSGSWLKLNDYRGIEGSLKREIILTTENNTNTTIRKAKVYVHAGNMTKVINVTQGIDNATESTEKVAVNTYVGAFWRANQTGERLIRIVGAVQGRWTAWVYDYGDFERDDIVFSTQMSSDPNIGWRDGADESKVADMNMASNDSRYSVPGDAMTASGTVIVAGGDIFFRVGLKSKWTAENGKTMDKPARYAVIVLSYNDNTKHQKIWLRQGEGADYLMRVGEESTVAIDNRVLPVKLSPYNLTTPEFKNGSNEENVLAEIQGFPAENYFTDYPTQAGAFYQFSPGYGVYAFHPSNPNGETKPKNWETSDNGTKFWDYLKNTLETCPAGYRRPSDGPTDINISNSTIYATESEIGQSLFLNPQSLVVMGSSATCESNEDNSVWGYYADGFFDRRAIEGQSTSSSHINEKTAVAINTPEVAYSGRLFYNPNSSNASIFFPAAGRRKNAQGHLEACGSLSYYWTSSAIASNGVHVYFSANSAKREVYSRSYGNSIRCVKDNTPPAAR